MDRSGLREWSSAKQLKKTYLLKNMGAASCEVAPSSRGGLWYLPTQEHVVTLFNEVLTTICVLTSATVPLLALRELAALLWWPKFENGGAGALCTEAQVVVCTYILAWLLSTSDLSKGCGVSFVPISGRAAGCFTSSYRHQALDDTCPEDWRESFSENPTVVFSSVQR